VALPHAAFARGETLSVAIHADSELAALRDEPGYWKSMLPHR
jgi:hypothetical protein